MTEVNQNASESKHPLYTYTALPPPVGDEHHFRLLKLFHTPNISRRMNQFEIEVHKLADAPEYEALSYCWGNAHPLKRAYTNGQRMRVTENLWIALKWLANKTSHGIGKEASHGYTYFWIDAICINQANLKERAYQVSIMRHIYQRASRTTVWLADVKTMSEDIDAKGNLIGVACEKLAKLQHRIEAAMPSEYQGLFDQELASDDPNTVSSTELQALYEFLEAPWFERVWCVQEVALAKSVMVFFGRLEIPWDTCLGVFQILRTLTHEHKRPVASSKGWNGLINMSLRRLDRQNGELENLSNVLIFSRYFKATDLRDKIYAVLNLSRNFQNYLHDSSSYQLSIRDVYRTWTLRILNQEKSLDIVSAIGRCPPENSDIEESWVPDWRDVPPNRFLPFVHVPFGHFCAAGSSALVEEISLDTRILRLKGRIVDRIDSVGLPWAHGDVVDGDKGLTAAKTLAFEIECNAAMLNWQRIYSLAIHRKYAHTKESFFDAFWRTAWGGRFEGDELESLLVKFRQFYRDREAARTAAFLQSPFVQNFFNRMGVTINDTKCEGDSGQQPRIGPPIQPQGLFPQNTDNKKLMREATGRCMVHTEKDYLGLAVVGVQVGDCVALLQGGRMPFTLRSCSGRWRIVGDCYVHGIMKGELWDEEQSSTLEIC